MLARDKRASLYALSFTLDCLALIAGYYTALQIRDERWLSAAGQPILFLAIPVFVLIMLAREVQAVETLESRLLAMRRGLGALSATLLVILGVSFVVNADEISRAGLALTFGAAAVYLVLGKLALDYVFNRTMHGQALATVLIRDGLEVESPNPALATVDVAAAGLWPDPDRPDKIDRLSHLVAPYDRVIVACRTNHRAAWASFLKGSDVGGEIVLEENLLMGAVDVGQVGGRDTLVMSLGPLNLVNRVQKRALDIAVSALALAALSPLLLLTAVAIKLDSPGPVLFRQRRVGLGGRQFDILKFRSMRQSDADGARSASRDDDRVTRVGRFIRRTSIDELPQLVNVLRGDMSMVGPRPHALGSRAGDQLFWHASEAYWMRHALKPGLTGLAQIRGYRGATDTEHDLQMRVHHDLEYVSGWSLWSDIVILLKTVRVVVHPNAY